MNKVKIGDLLRKYRFLVYSKREGSTNYTLNLDRATPEVMLSLVEQLEAMTNAVIAKAESLNPDDYSTGGDFKFLLGRADIIARAQLFLEKLDLMRRVCVTAMESSGTGYGRSVAECVTMPLMLGWYPKIEIGDDGQLFCSPTEQDGEMRFIDPDQKTQSFPLIERPIQLRDMLEALTSQPTPGINTLLRDFGDRASDVWEATKEIAEEAYDATMREIDNVAKTAAKAVLPASIVFGAVGALGLFYLIGKAK